MISFTRHLPVAGAVFVALAVAVAPDASADETDARALLQGMSDYLAAQETFGVGYDSNLDIVTTDLQKIGLAASGKVQVQRPGKLHATRTGGFSDIEMVFDGTQLAMFGKHTNAYTLLPVEGSIDTLIDDLRDIYGRPVPAADLLTSDAFGLLMQDVIDIKDLGAGMIAGRMCDHLAFRTHDVDWQIWIAQGDAPLPCRFSITTKMLAQAPQYTVDLRDWQVGLPIAPEVFAFVAPQGAQEVAFDGSEHVFRDLPTHFSTGDDK
jgi:hypothetical protein